MSLAAELVERTSPPTPALRDLRVLVFCDYYGPGNNGGTERVAREVNTRLASWGADVTVLTAVEHEHFDDDGVRVLPLRAVNLSSIVRAQLAIAPTYQRTGRGAIRFLQPHVLHAHSLHFHGTVTAARLSRRFRIPLVTTAHVAGMEHVRGLTRVLAEVQERTIASWILQQSTLVVAVSDAVRTHCIALGAEKRRISVARNGVDHNRFRPVLEPEDSPPLVLYVGRLIADKGPQNLLSACVRVARSGGRFRVAFVGDGPLRQRLVAEAAANGLDAEFPGHSNDVAGWMRRANVVVLSSYKEGAPLVIAEAMASQRCVLASALPPTRELITDGVDGLLHPPGDVKTLAAQLSSILADDMRRGRLAAEARVRASQLTWEATARGHATALMQVVGGREAK